MSAMQDGRKLRVLFAAAMGLSFGAGASAPAGRYQSGVGSLLDTVTGLTWQAPGPGGTYSFADAQSYCAALTTSGLSAGSWRLPGRLELESIVDFSASAPAADHIAFKTMTQSAYWTSTPYFIPGLTGYYWTVEFAHGSASLAAETGQLYVVCVYS